ncbi:MAG: F0F1 ATP synthase subunit B [Candidatus Latescibacteria bacterium]|nr:F0F1 ATP synthase subunit B [Candidatus Latescibacterota bacterium]
MISINATVILTILNFILLVAVLSAILWKPMSRFLDERAKKIDESLVLAEENKRRSEEIKVEQDRILKEARLKATEIVDKAMARASSESREHISQAKQQAQSIVDSAKKEIWMEAERIKQELRSEVASMSIDLAGKVLEREIKEDDHRELISRNLDTMGV